MLAFGSISSVSLDMAGGAGDAGSVGTTVWLGALVAKRAGGRMLEDKRPRESEKMLRRRQSADNGAGPWTHGLGGAA